MAKLAQELLVATPNKAGMLAKVCGTITAAGANITAICAYVVADEGYFRIISSDNAKAKTALESSGFRITENEVVIAELENKAGAAKEMAQKLARAGIDLKNIYGTTSGTGLATLVFTADNNPKAVGLLN